MSDLESDLKREWDLVTRDNVRDLNVRFGDDMTAYVGSYNVERDKLLPNYGSAKVTQDIIKATANGGVLTKNQETLLLVQRVSDRMQQMRQAVNALEKIMRERIKEDDESIRTTYQRKTFKHLSDDEFYGILKEAGLDVEPIKQQAAFLDSQVPRQG